MRSTYGILTNIYPNNGPHVSKCCYNLPAPWSISPGARAAFAARESLAQFRRPGTLGFWMLKWSGQRKPSRRYSLKYHFVYQSIDQSVEAPIIDWKTYGKTSNPHVCRKTVQDMETEPHLSMNFLRGNHMGFPDRFFCFLQGVSIKYMDYHHPFLESGKINPPKLIIYTTLLAFFWFCSSLTVWWTLMAISFDFLIEN